MKAAVLTSVLVLALAIGTCPAAGAAGIVRLSGKAELIATLEEDGLKLGSTVWLRRPLHVLNEFRRVSGLTRVTIEDVDLVSEVQFGSSSSPKVVVVRGKLADGTDVSLILSRSTYMSVGRDLGDVQRAFYLSDPAKAVKKWGKATIEAIAARQVRAGMTGEQVRVSWGSPDHVNTSSGSWGQHEQWVYGEPPNSSYLYFENGRLRSVQQ